MVSFGLGRGDSRAVGGGGAADRLVMALLRALAGVIMVGAGTLRATPDHQWTAETLLPGRAADIAALRSAAGRSPEPAPLLVVSGAGRVPWQADRTVLTAAGGGALEAAAIMAEAHRLAGGGPVLCEGGPSLLGTLLDGGVPLDLFLTVAPQMAGRRDGDPNRLSLVEGVTLAPFSRRGVLRSVRAAGDHLLLRYAIDA